jgi:hypothetical protein
LIKIELQTQLKVVNLRKEEILADSAPGEDDYEMEPGTAGPEDLMSQAESRDDSENRGEWGASTGTAVTPPHTSDSPSWSASGAPGATSPEGNQSPGWGKDNVWHPATPNSQAAGGETPGGW